MIDAVLHHVTLATPDLDRARTFYRNVFGFEEIPRPPFAVPGVWLRLGGGQLHLVENPGGTFRSNSRIDTSDVHFAVRVANFEAAIARLATAGFEEARPEGDPRNILVLRHGLAGFAQAYLRDPDGHIVEINDAP